MQSQSTKEYNSQDHIYPTKVSANSFKICDLNSKLICFAIGFINSFMTEVPIFRENQWTGFYMIGTSVMKELQVQQYGIDSLQKVKRLTLILFYLESKS